MRLLSWSAVDDYLKCPRYYLLKRVLKLPVDSGAGQALVVGSTYHAVLAEVAQAPDWREALFPVTQAAIVENEDKLLACGVDLAQLEDEIQARISDMQRTFKIGCGGLDPVFDSKPIEGVELRFDDPDMGFCGYIDLFSTRTPNATPKADLAGWEERPCVVDYKVKTGKNRRTQRDAELSGQLALYALQRGVDRAAFIEIPRDLKKPVRVLPVEYSEKELGRWRVWFERIREAILTAETWQQSWLENKVEPSAPPCARTNGLCSPRWCEGWDYCYEGKPIFEVTENANV